MIAPDVSNSAHSQDQRKTPAARLEESLRDLVHEEMGVVRAEAQKPVASRSDAFWLFLCVADAALIIWLLPEAAFGDKRLELLGKVFTWLGGSLFVLGYVWFRDLFLAYVRHKAFKITLLAIPGLVLPFYITQVRIFSVKPQVEPSNAEIEIDRTPVDINGIRLSLQPHEVLVRIKGEGPNPYTRKFPLTRSDVWRTWWRDEQPYWPISFYVPIDFIDEAPEKIELVKEDGRFDREFRQSVPELTFINENGENKSHSGLWTEDGRMQFSRPTKPDSISGVGFTLPYGKYHLTASFTDKEACEKTATVIFMAKPGVESTNSAVIAVERKCGDQK